MPRSPRPSPVYLVLGALSGPGVKAIFRHRATGVENVPRDGGVLLAANNLANVIAELERSLA